MKELVVISGKGGTGKTSLTACLALLYQPAIIADCDVDAADLHLILSPREKERHEFWCGVEASIDPQRCNDCGLCRDLCRFDAIKEEKGHIIVDPTACEGCGVCARFCPQHAITLSQRLSGSWSVSETRAGLMVHAKLGIAAENSGKLVSTVRNEAKRLAQETGRSLVLIDGPPGIACPVIASVTGATAALVVTEPTPSGTHDLLRVLELLRHVNVRAFVCLNKWDLCPDQACVIETLAQKHDAPFLGRIRYDRGVTDAQRQAKAIIETQTPSAQDIIDLWGNLIRIIP